MAVVPSFMDEVYEITKCIEVRLREPDCPLHNIREAVQHQLFFYNFYHITEDIVLSQAYLDYFICCDGKYEVYIRMPAYTSKYQFLYSETKKYRALLKMEI